ncbi:type ISP restriction/modification enzyme [Streptomyces sp. NPDC051561]|uniref:type ISP restriction/modification enzyme n=1 Tax=Streptomyces sp. NPDC051561 TaxID=3365658 RepID=UPI00379838EF
MRCVSDVAETPQPLLLDDLMPWSVAPLRLGRSWVMGPDPASLRARWDRVIQADEADRDALFSPTRLRTPRTSVAALPGQRTAGTLPLALSCVRAGEGTPAADSGRCPDPVRVLHGPFDEQWLIPDHRLIDTARPELWRVTDPAHQIFAIEQGYVPGAAGPALLASALLPDGRSPAGRPGRIRPLYRRPDGQEPNLTPGLSGFLGKHYGREVTPEDVLAWALASARPSPRGSLVPLPRDLQVWSVGVELGHRLLTVLLRGAHGADRPRLPGGRRPYVRAAVGPRPDSLTYDREESALLLGASGRISPVPAAAWDFEVGGVRVLERWFEERTAEPSGPLEGVRPREWPQEWNSELLELVTVLALYAEAAGGGPAQDSYDQLTRNDLLTAGVLPVPAAVRRPASVLDHHEEGPGGQFALL